MKKIAMLTLSLIATAAMAGGGYSGRLLGPTAAAKVEINAPSVQVTSLGDSGLGNTAEGGGVAAQNLASNTGQVTVNGSQLQVVATNGSGVWNQAQGRNAVAVSNLASNYGNVSVNNASIQVVAAHRSSIANLAKAGSTAVQNVSTNNGCATCN